MNKPQNLLHRSLDNETLKSKGAKSKGAKPKHYVIFFCCILTTYILSKQLIIIRGDSLNASLAWLLSVSDDTPLKKGDIVTFNYSHVMFDNNNEEILLVKRVACLPNATFIKVSSAIFCNGAFIGEAKIARNNGDLFPVFTYKGIIPEGEYFLLGDSLDSFDSRYIGFVKKENLQHLGLVIF
ncbi:MAG: signal peptidase I [Alteromonadaceae bacterium]|nr:signal peptidase I [Alteromonadaceae bacterium]